MIHMIEIIIPVLICLVIAVVCAVILTLTSHFFSVKEDEKAVAIRDCLAGANCGACGYSGCDGYAKALADGTCTKINLCTPGGDSVAKQISEILGVEVEDVEKKVAYIACNGNCDVVGNRYNYQGHKSCKIANMSYSGDKMCSYACLGYGDCKAICPNNAISIKDGVAHVNEDKCIGCGMCVKTCPKGIIKLISPNELVKIACSNRDKGIATKKVCSNGCIGCGLCSKKCPEGAITVVNNLAQIDYTKCSKCGICSQVCPVKCIH